MDNKDRIVETLTKRELEILQLLAENQTNQEIAGRLSLALSSVKWYAGEIYGKLGVENRRQAIQKAAALGLLEKAPSSPPPIRPALPSGMVTFLFTDIEGSTPLWEQMPEAMRGAVARHHELLRQAIEANSGHVFQVIGDAFQGAFRLAADGLCAALAAQHALQEAHWGPTGPLRVRMGLHTGPAELASSGDAPYAVSHTLNRASRVMSAGYGGQILLSQEAKDLVERELPAGVTLLSLGEHHLKGLERPEHLYQVVAPGLPQAFPALATAIQNPNNLPPELTSFIGREEEIEALAARLRSAETRLLTLTGSGGTGKTRLSLKVAEKVLAAFPDGVWLVELAPLGDPDLIVPTAAQALGVREVPGMPLLDTLCSHLHDRRLLLILDNCEHLLSGCARLADTLLKKCPRLCLLASSREILNVPGETPFRVPSLPVPEAKPLPPLAELARFEAVRLFVERAAQAAGAFALDDANAQAVITICRRLDGIPLAIELAASRVRVMPVGQVAARLDNVFRLLLGGSRTLLPRQQTLKATIDWSYALLNPQERLALQRLSVFAGGWTLETAEQIVPDPPAAAGCARETLQPEEMLEVLASLVDKSLVVFSKNDTGGADLEPRYHMLETIRQYGRDRLIEADSAGELSECSSEAVRDRHLAYFIRLAEQAGAEIRTNKQVAWLTRLEAEIENLRLALEWSLGTESSSGTSSSAGTSSSTGTSSSAGISYAAGRIEAGMRLHSALIWFWHLHDHHAEGAQWAGRLLEAEASVRGSQPLRPDAQPLSYLLAWSRCVSAMIFLTYFRSDVRPFRPLPALTEENILLCRAIGEPASYELAWALRERAGHVLRGNPDADADYQESLEICRRRGYRDLETEILLVWALSIPDFQQRVSLLEAGLALSRELGDPDSTASHLGNLALSSHFHGDYERAKRYIVECLETYENVNNLTSEALFSVIWFYIDPRPESARRAYRGLDFFRQNGPEMNVLYFSICAHTEWSLGNAGPAEALAQEGLAIARRAARHSDQVFPLIVLTHIALDQGALAQAGQYLREGRGVAREADIVDGWLWVLLLDTLALYLLASGKPADAAQVFGGLDALYQYVSPGSAPRLRSDHAAALSALRQALDEAAFTQAWQAGQALTLWQAYLAGMEGV